MALTLSHQSALDVYRVLRAEGYNPHEMDATSLAVPAPWVGKRFTAKDFDPSVWRWPTPNRERPLHILVPARDCRRYIAGCCAHTSIRDLPPRSILWLDEHASIVSPELLFLQMADVFSFPALVMLGYELCGHFARSPSEPRDGVISDDIAAATDTASIKNYLSKVGAKRGVIVARRALQYVHDHALSSPEAILALMYSLPPEEGGYGMGPVTLNMRVDVDDCDNWTGAKTRLPDLMFSFAPVGINYDGSKHLDLGELVRLARQAALSGADERDEANSLLGSKMAEVREKFVDDIMRNRQLAASGKMVFVAVKEDLYGWGHLDELTRQILRYATTVFDVDVSEFLKTLDDTDKKRERHELLDAFLPHGDARKHTHGCM